VGGSVAVMKMGGGDVGVSGMVTTSALQAVLRISTGMNNDSNRVCGEFGFTPLLYPETSSNWEKGIDAYGIKTLKIRTNSKNLLIFANCRCILSL